MEEQVSRLPSTANAASPLANVEDCSAGLNKATFLDSTSSASVKREAFCLDYRKVVMYVVVLFCRQTNEKLPTAWTA